MKKINILFVLCAFTFLSINALAQVAISGDDFNTCDNFIYDGNDTGDYSPGMDETITVCPEAPETIVNLYWTGFILGDGDKIVIHDGPDDSYPAISINGQGGAAGFTGNQLYLVDVTSTTPSGCLTIHFTSNADESTGNFTALVSCGLPCAKPVPSIAIAGEDTSQHILVCKDETITFDASGTTFPNNTSYQSVVWDFGDGMTNTSAWPTVNKLFSVPGAYKVNVYVTNNLGCQSVITLNVVVKVATLPEITAVADDYYVCVGQQVNLTGDVTGVTWTASPQIDFGGALFLPDTQGQCFNDTLMVSNFDNSQTITSVSDLLGFAVSMEHSFIGDLVITFICPDGSSLVVHNQNGGGIWLGTPCDQDSNPNQAGRPGDYGWSPTATNPTWANAVVGTNTTQVADPCTGTGNSLNPGMYSAVGDWNSLVGCPLNGAWVIQVCDNWGSDNGFIFGWNVQFNPALYSEDLSFTPTFGASCDSTYWLGQNIVDNGGLCDDVVVVPPTPGTYNYSYVAIDNHGCVYSQPISIVAYEGPVVVAADDFYFCGPEVALASSVTNPQPGIQYSYTWNNPTLLSNPNTATTNILQDALTSDTTEFVISVYPIGDQQCLVHDTVLVIVPEYPPFAPNDTIRVCAGEFGDLFAPTVDNDPYTYQWYYSVDNTDFEAVSGANFRSLEVNTQGFYQVYVYEPGCNFMSPSPFWVEVYSCVIKYPNVFTPNGDGKNDMFEIYGMTEFPGSSLIVYNRWGQIVYENKDYRNNWNGGELPEGVYYFIAEVNKQAGKEPHAGYFHLVRK